MVHLKTEEEIQILIRESAQILGKAHGEVAKLDKAWREDLKIWIPRSPKSSSEITEEYPIV